MGGDLGERGSVAPQADGDSVFILTPDHRERYLARLDPPAFDGAVLRRYYEELTGVAASGVEYALLDGVAFLRDALAPLRSEIVAVVFVVAS
jgi:hypothetical protein